MRMGRARRLRKGPEFDRVFSEGTALGGPFLVIRYLENESGPRWGFAVGKKAAPLATSRNRVKRRLKAAAQGLERGPRADIIVVARTRAIGQPYRVLEADLRKLLRKAELLEDPQ
jgi:ribonuclease P protein component